MAVSKFRRTRGFTLVELLVVIGIIALLISILLPTLSRAQASARAVACASNQRQVVLASNIYAGDNGQVLPPGSSTSGTGDWAPFWYDFIMEYVGEKVPDAFSGGAFDAKEYGEAFVCGSATIEAGYMHYNVHPRLMPPQPPAGSVASPPATGNALTGKAFKPFKLAQIPESSEILFVADARQFDAPNVDGGRVHGNAPSFMGAFANNGIYSHKFVRSPGGSATAGAVSSTSLPLFGIGNRDLSAAAGEWGNGDLRFRHKDNNSINVGFADGHVEAFGLGENSDFWDSNTEDVDAGELTFRNVMLIDQY